MTPTEQIKQKEIAFTEIHPASLAKHSKCQQKTELIGDRREGYIVVPLKTSRRRIKL